MNNTFTNKIKHFPQLFALGPEMSSKRKWRDIPSWLTISIKLDKYVYKYSDIHISKGLMWPTCLVIINIWLDFLLEINPYQY